MKPTSKTSSAVSDLSPQQTVAPAESLAPEPGSRLRLARWPDLWIEGDPTAFEPPVVAIVGTRRPDPHGARLAYRIARGLGEAGVGVASGGALGIDACVHAGGLEGGRRNTVVLPCGTGHTYPVRHRGLFDRVLATGGAVLSPFPPDTPPARWTFPRRNELLAALADVLVVVQAPADSGSLLTAEAALRQGRRILVVPAAPDDPKGAGCLRLLRAGAAVCTDVPDVLRVLEARDGPLFEPRPVRSPSVREKSARSRPKSPTHAAGPSDPPPAGAAVPPHLSQELRSVWEATDVRGRHPDDLSTATGLGAAAVRSALLQLELLGLVAERGGSYVRAGA